MHRRKADFKDGFLDLPTTGEPRSRFHCVINRRSVALDRVFYAVPVRIEPVKPGKTTHVSIGMLTSTFNLNRPEVYESPFSAGVGPVTHTHPIN